MKLNALPIYINTSQQHEISTWKKTTYNRNLNIFIGAIINNIKKTLGHTNGLGGRDGKRCDRCGPWKGPVAGKTIVKY